MWMKNWISALFTCITWITTKILDLQFFTDGTSMGVSFFHLHSICANLCVRAEQVKIFDHFVVLTRLVKCQMCRSCSLLPLWWRCFSCCSLGIWVFCMRNKRFSAGFSQLYVSVVLLVNFADSLFGCGKIFPVYLTTTDIMTFQQMQKPEVKNWHTMTVSTDTCTKANW